MIEYLEVINPSNEKLTIELKQPEKTGLNVWNIEGLGPGQANINTTEMATSDGALFNSAKLLSRQILITFKFLWSRTVEEARLRMYKYFPIKQNVTIIFKTENRLVRASCYVSNVEAVIFSKEAHAQIELIAPDPYFYSYGPGGKTTTVFFGVEPAFEFPFSNESLTEPLIEFGKIRNETSQTIWYEGDAPIGMTIFMHAIGTVRNVSLYDLGTREAMYIDTDKLEELTGSGIVAGDEIIINTVRGDKYVRLLRNGVYTNIRNCIAKDPDWFLLYKGDNLFAYAAEEGIGNLQFRIENETIFEGI